MKLCMFSPSEMDLPRGWPGKIDGDRVIQVAAQTIQAFFSGGGTAREHAEYPLADVVLRPPVTQPPSVRVFSGFPSFRFANPAAILGPEADVRHPEGSSELGYGLGIAAMIGAEGQIGGFTVLNDWTAHDLAPAKDGDFATSIGPVVVTLDEFSGSGSIVVRVNGQERSRVDVAITWDRLIEHAARNTRLLPGDIVGQAVPHADEAWLEPGDVVEVEVDAIGVLRNTVR